MCIYLKGCNRGLGGVLFVCSGNPPLPMLSKMRVSSIIDRLPLVAFVVPRRRFSKERVNISNGSLIKGSYF